eukprot:Colp12_sorted_trinity150504_noHs@7061
MLCCASTIYIFWKFVHESNENNAVLLTCILGEITNYSTARQLCTGGFYFSCSCAFLVCSTNMTSVASSATHNTTPITRPAISAPVSFSELGRITAAFDTRGAAKVPLLR